MVNKKDSSISNIHAGNQKTLQQLYKEKEKNLPRILYPAKLCVQLNINYFPTCKVQEIQYPEIFHHEATDKCATTKMKYIFMK